MPDRIEEAVALRKSISANMSSLAELLNQCKDADEEVVYRFYHQSYKVYRLQEKTQRIVAALASLAPHLPMNPWFLEIVQEGTGKVFDGTANQQWTKLTRPILEAFFHARYFLGMVCKYGPEAGEEDGILTSGWAAVLTLYNIR